jgi:hypothetical protein
MDYNIALPQFNAPAAQVGGPVNMLTDVMKLQGLQQDQQLNQLKFQEYQRARGEAALKSAQEKADKQALISAMRNSVVGDVGPQQPDARVAANALLAQGRINPAMTALGASEAFNKDTKAKSDLAKIDIENLDKEFKTFSTFSRQVRSPEDAGVYAEAMYDHPTIGKLMQRTGLTKEQAIAKAQQDYAADPVRWVASHVDLTGQQAVDTLKQTTTNTDMGGQMLQQQRDAFGRPIEGGETRLAKTPVPKDAADKETPEQKLKYQEDLQKQKSRVDLEISHPAAKAAYDASVGDIDAQIARAKSLKEHRGLRYITGSLAGRTPSARDAATSAQADLDQILAKAGFEALQQMRDRSPTGGALGNVSDTEGKRLQDSAAALKQAQGTKTFQAKLDRYVADLERAKGNVKNTFDLTYAGIKPAAGKPLEGEVNFGELK